MIVTLNREADLESVKGRLAGLGLWVGSVERSRAGEVHLVVGNASAAVDTSIVEGVPGVSSVSAPASVHPRVDAMGPSVSVGDQTISPRSPIVVAGPCAVESEEQIERIAGKLAERYAFQGHGRSALDWLRAAADRTGMKVVTEVLSETDVDAVADRADVLQVGSRNMQAFSLLKAVGRAEKPVLLKRSMAATVEEWLLAGEYLLSHGAKGVVFCERGVRGFDPSTRNLLDLGAVALLAAVHGLPVIVQERRAAGAPPRERG